MENDLVKLIQEKLQTAYLNMDNDHQKVLYAIWQEWGKQKITQGEIAKCAFDIGHHEKHEEPRKNNETTLRKVRQMIRDLRILYLIPILSDKNGYWIPQRKEECQEYLERIEAVARAQAAAWYETYRAMEKTVGVHSEFFNKQESFLI